MIKHKISRIQALTNQYTVLKLLGEGGFAEVYLAQNKNDKTKVALKCINKRQLLNNNPGLTLIQLDKLLKDEVQIMNRIDNPNVLKCYQVLHDDQEYKVMAMEYCDGKNLSEIIQKHGKIQQKKAIKIFTQIMNGFAAMHVQKIIHRDIKPENILYDQKTDTYKIADFGLAKNVSQLTKSQRATLVGTQFTMAPQVRKLQQYAVQADLWSLGVVLYEMVVGLPPKFEKYTQQEIDNMTSDMREAGISPQLYELLTSIFIVDASKRLSWSNLYKMCNQKTGIFGRGDKPRQSPFNKVPTNRIPPSDSKQQFPQKEYSRQFYDMLIKINLTKKDYEQHMQKLELNLKKMDVIQSHIIQPLYDINHNTLNNFQNYVSSTELQRKFLLLVVTQVIKILEEMEDYIVGDGKAGKYSSLSKLCQKTKRLNNQVKKMYKIKDYLVNRFEDAVSLSYEYLTYSCSTQEHINKIKQVEQQLFNLGFLKKVRYWLCCCKQNPEIVDLRQFLRWYQFVVTTNSLKSLQGFRK